MSGVGVGVGVVRTVSNIIGDCSCLRICQSRLCMIQVGWSYVQLYITELDIKGPNRFHFAPSSAAQKPHSFVPAPQ